MSVVFFFFHWHVRLWPNMNFLILWATLVVASAADWNEFISIAIRPFSWLVSEVEVKCFYDIGSDQQFCQMPLWKIIFIIIIVMFFPSLSEMFPLILWTCSLNFYVFILYCLYVKLLELDSAREFVLYVLFKHEVSFLCSWMGSAYCGRHCSKELLGK